VRECIEVVREFGGNPTTILAVVDRAPQEEGRFDMPHHTVIALDVETFSTDECVMCKEGTTAIKPGSRGNG